MARPDRSDAHLLPEEEARLAAEAREFFDGVVPKRHTKPSRSEHSSVYADALLPPDQPSDRIPELLKLHDLEAQPQKLVCDGGEAAEEFVETEYYKDLSCVDKQHHTTGTGFIEMEKSGGGSSFKLKPDSDPSDHHASCKGNPATNDWIPSVETVAETSHKPSRSDS